MASLTNKTRSIRSRKKAKAGSVRKRKLRTQGSTPKFAIHQDAKAGTAKSKSKS